MVSPRTRSLTETLTQGQNTTCQVVRAIQRKTPSLPTAYAARSWLTALQDEEKQRLKGDVHRLVAPRDQKHQSNFVEFRGTNRIVYRRYAGLFFCVCVDATDNELAYLEAVHFFVEVLDSFFGNVCELDLVFNFYKVRIARVCLGRGQY